MAGKIEADRDRPPLKTDEPDDDKASPVGTDCYIARPPPPTDGSDEDKALPLSTDCYRPPPPPTDETEEGKASPVQTDSYIPPPRDEWDKNRFLRGGTCWYISPLSPQGEEWDEDKKSPLDSNWQIPIKIPPSHVFEELTADLGPSDNEDAEVIISRPGRCWRKPDIRTSDDKEAPATSDEEDDIPPPSGSALRKSSPRKSGDEGPLASNDDEDGILSSSERDWYRPLPYASEDEDNPSSFNEEEVILSHPGKGWYKLAAQASNNDQTPPSSDDEALIPPPSDSALHKPSPHASDNEENPPSSDDEVIPPPSDSAWHKPSSHASDDEKITLSSSESGGCKPSPHTSEDEKNEEDWDAPPPVEVLPPTAKEFCIPPSPPSHVNGEEVIPLAEVCPYRPLLPLADEEMIPPETGIPPSPPSHVNGENVLLLADVCPYIPLLPLADEMIPPEAEKECYIPPLIYKKTEIPPEMTNVNFEEFQSQELGALDAYYADRNIFALSDKPSEPGGEFWADVQRDGVAMTVKMASKEDDSGVQKCSISYLPPICLWFSLPKTYPFFEPPNFTISCRWLSEGQLAFVCDALDHFWQVSHAEHLSDGHEPSGVLWTWTYFLREQLLQYLNIKHHMCISIDEISDRPLPEVGPRIWPTVKELRYMSIPVDKIRMTCMTPENILRVQDPRVRKGNISGPQLFALLVDYDKEQRKVELRKLYYECNVCFETKRSIHCLHLEGCDHVFCRECLAQYCKEQISQANSARITCLEPGCAGLVHPDQLQELLDDEWMARFQVVRVNAAVAESDDLRHCPRPGCGKPVQIDIKNSVGVCSYCNFPFCIHCNKTFHGVERCKFNTVGNHKLLQRYKNSDPSEKKAMEKAYGPKFFRHLREEFESSAWLEQNSKKCPSCQVYVQKSAGCNKMTCHNCHSYFCWLCGEKIPKDEPYKHFNSFSGQPCSNRLFEGVEQEAIDFYDFNEDIEGAEEIDDVEDDEDLEPNDNQLRIVEVIRNDNRGDRQGNQDNDTNT